MEVKRIIKLFPNEMWKQIVEFSGITQEFFMEYFENREYAYAYEFSTITFFEQYRELSYYNISYALQSYIY